MRKFFSRRSLLSVLLAGLVAGGVLLCANRPNAGRAADAVVPDQEAVQRAHDIVKMLDDLHKDYVVNITATYVKARERTPAAHVAKKVFEHMEKNGWGTSRLIDATGEPVNKSNVARTSFEKRAIKKLSDGKTYYSEVERKNGQSFLYAATPVPVVMKQCISCHPGSKEGDLLGALVYEVPIK